MSDHEKHERFLALLEPIREKLSRYTLSMTDSSEDARDLMSDTIVQAYERLDGLREPDAFCAYVFTIARRIQQRRRTRRRLFGAFDQQAAETIPSATISPELSADVTALHNALERLPHKQREAVVLFDISGFSLKEIRDLQGASLSAVKTRIARGRKRLAELLRVADDLHPPQGDSASAQPLPDKTDAETIGTTISLLTSCIIADFIKQLL